MQKFVILLIVSIIAIALCIHEDGIFEIRNRKLERIEAALKNYEEEPNNFEIPEGCVLNPNIWRLPDSISPILYNIHLSPNLKTFSFVGKSTIVLNVKERTTCVVFHAEDLKIFDITLQTEGQPPQKPIKEIFYKELNQMHLIFAQPLEVKQYSLHLSFSGEIRNDLRGFYRSNYYVGEEERWLAVTQFEAINSRTAFPNWDEPKFRSRFYISFLVNRDEMVYSNMPITQTRDEPGDKKFVQFAVTPIMPSYLVAYVVGEKLERVTKTGKNEVLYGVITTEGKSIEGDFALEICEASITWFEQFFGVKYGLPKLDMVALPDFRGGAMENWGLVTYRESYLLKNENTTLSNIKNIVSIIYHENSHMWTGNYVTMKWWSELFLKEGWATFFAVYGVDFLFPEWHVWNDYNLALQSLLKHDALPSSFPLSNEVNTSSQVDSRFDLISYQKGGTVYRMIQRYLGHQIFQKMMSNFIKHNIFGAIETPQLLKEIAPYIPPSYLHNWMYKPGYPVVTLSEVGPNTYRLSQERFYSYIEGPRDTTLWWIPITVIGSNGIKFNISFATKYSQPFPGAGDWIKINVDHSGYYRVNYTPELWRKLISAVQSKSIHLKVNDRFELLDDAFALAGAGMSKINLALDFAIASKDERESTVWATLVNDINQLANRIASQPLSLQEKYNKFVLEILKPSVDRLGWEEKPGEPIQDTLLRPIILENAARYGESSVVDEAIRRFASGNIAPELKKVIYNTAIKYGGIYEYEAMMRLFQQYKEDPIERRLIMEALTLPKDTKLVLKTLNLMLSNDVRSQDGHFIIRFAANNNLEKLPIIWTWFKENYDKIVEKYGLPTVERRLIVGVTEQFSTKEDYDDVKNFFEGRSAAKEVSYALANIQRNRVYLDNVIEDLKEYFNE